MTFIRVQFLIGLWGIIGGIQPLVSADLVGTLTFQKASNGQGVTITLPTPSQKCAAFLRQGYFWLALPTSLSLTIQSLPKGFSKPERLPITQGAQGTLIRLRIPQDTFPTLTKEQDKQVIFLSTRPQKTPLPHQILPVDILKVNSQEKTAAITIADPQALHFRDPVTHHSLFIIPTSEIGNGFPTRLTKRDFSLLPTTQGILIEASPHVMVRETENHLYISKVGGLNLSPSADVSFASTQKKPLLNPLASFDKTRLATLQELLPHSKGRERLTLEWELIHQQIMDEQATEALAHLDRLAKKYPSWENLQDFQMLRGLSLFIKNQLRAAFYTFSNPHLGPQTTPWLLATRLKNGDIQETLDSLEKKIKEITLLPQPFQGNILLLAAQASIHADRANKALPFLRSLPKSLSLEQKKYADSLMKQVIFEPLLPGPPSLSETPPLTQPRPYLHHEAVTQTQLEMLLAAHKVGRISDKKLTQELEKMKWESKSPTFESQILKLLGTLYDKENHHLKSLEYYHAFLTRYPKDPDHPAILKQAVVSYHDAILDPHFPFVRKIALFRKFSSLLENAPEKSRLIKTIASEMVQHHLVDEATELLSKSIASEVDPPLLIQLAEIYLIDEKPHHVLKLLTHFADKFSATHHNTINVLKARALAETGDYDQALSLLPSDDQRNDSLYRADFFFQKEDWEKAAQAYQKVWNQETTDSSLLDRFATALYMSEQFENLKALFTPENFKRSSFLKSLSKMLPAATPKDLKELRALLQSLPENVAL